MVQFELTRKVDNVVCVNGYRGLIWECQEPYPVVQCEKPCACALVMIRKSVSVRAMEMVSRRKTEK